MSTNTPISPEVAEHIATLIDVSSVDYGARVVVVKIPPSMNSVFVQPVLEQLAHLFSPHTSVIVLPDDMSLETVSEEDMAAAGWVRATGC